MLIMTEHKTDPSVGGMIIVLLVLFNAIILKSGFVSNDHNWSGLLITVPLLLIAVFARWRNKKSH